MISVNAADAQDKLSELIDQAGQGRERIRIEQHGKPVAAIISYEDLERLEAISAKRNSEGNEDAIDSAALRQAMEQSEGFITIDELLAIRPLEA